MAAYNIFQQYAQPVRSVMDYAADLDKAESNQLALMGQRRSNELAGLTIQQQQAAARQAIARQNALQRLVTNPAMADPVAREQAMLADPYLMDDGLKLRKERLAADHVAAQTESQRATAGKATFETGQGKQKSLLQIAASLTSPQEAADLIDGGAKGGDLPAPVADAMKRMVLSDPNWQQKLILTIASPETAKGILAPHMVAAGGALVNTNPVAGPTGQGAPNAIPITQTADNAATNATSRANNAATVAEQARAHNMSDRRASEQNSIARDAVGKVEWKQDTNGNWLALPKEVKSGQPVVPITTTAAGKREVQAGHALDIIAEARGLIDKGTSSYAGAAVDQGARLFGASTPGSEAGAKLKALEGALMMAQPRMEGPQSDKDVMLYKQMAGQIGDPTVPAGNKAAALDAIEALHRKYAPDATNQQPATPKATNAKGWKLHTDAQGNRAYVSPDGKQFEEVK